MDKELANKIIDELYHQYECDHSLRTTLYIHPMFYNGTYSENNECKPEEPEHLLTKEEFIEKINKDSDFKWGFAFQVLFMYISK